MREGGHNEKFAVENAINFKKITVIWSTVSAFYKVDTMIMYM